MRDLSGLWAGFRIAVAQLVACVALLPAVLMGGAGAAGAETRALCVHDVPAGQVLRVREGPGYAAAVTGEFHSGACGVRLVGRCDGDWCEMALGAKVGWVNTRYIGIYALPGADATKTATTKMPVLPGPERRTEAHRLALPAASTVPGLPPAAVEKTARHGLGFGVPPSHGRSEAAAGACVVRVEKWDSLRIRSGPGVGHNEIGDIPPGACRVEHIGGCQGEWCRIAWRGRTGWVNTYYLD